MHWFDRLIYFFTNRAGAQVSLEQIRELHPNIQVAYFDGSRALQSLR